MLNFLIIFRIILKVQATESVKDMWTHKDWKEEAKILFICIVRYIIYISI